MLHPRFVKNCDEQDSSVALMLSGCFCAQVSGVKSSEGSWPSPSRQTSKTETPQLRPKWRRSVALLLSSTRGSSRSYDKRLVRKPNRSSWHCSSSGTTELHLSGIDLENIVYYKDDTHYFVMTAKKHSLLEKGVIVQVESLTWSEQSSTIQPLTLRCLFLFRTLQTLSCFSLGET